MAKVVSFGYVDTPLENPESLSIKLGTNYGADFRTRVDDPNEVVMTNLTAAQGRPEKFRWAFTEIPDVYKNTDIEPALRNQTKGGVQILCELTDVWTVTDSEDATYNVALPLKAHLVLRVPNTDFLSVDQIQYLVNRLVSGLYDQGSISTERLSALLRGSLKPST